MPSSITRKSFGVTQGGHQVDQITLANSAGTSATFFTYGATLMRLLVPDKNKQLGDVVLGFDDLKQHENLSPYFGAIIGRVGNRIARGLFCIDQNRYAVVANNGPNHLHGGFRGYDKRIWNADTAMTSDGPGVRFTLLDPDGAEGYPGNVNVTVIYTLSSGNALKIQYSQSAQLSHDSRHADIDDTVHRTGDNRNGKIMRADFEGDVAKLRV